MCAERNPLRLVDANFRAPEDQEDTFKFNILEKPKNGPDCLAYISGLAEHCDSFENLPNETKPEALRMVGDIVVSIQYEPGIKEDFSGDLGFELLPDIIKAYEACRDQKPADSNTPFLENLTHLIAEAKDALLDAISLLAIDDRNYKRDKTNPAFLYILREGARRPEIVLKYGHRLSPISGKNINNPYFLSERVTEQKEMDTLGEVLSEAKSLEELLHLLSLVSDKSLIVNKNPEYRQTYPVANVIGYIQGKIREANLEKSIFEDGEVNTLQKKRANILELKKKLLTHEAWHPLTRYVGNFNLRGFVNEEISKKIKSVTEYIESARTYKPLRDRSDWIEIVWYVDMTISLSHVYRFHYGTAVDRKNDPHSDSSTENVERIGTLTGQEIVDLVMNAPLGTAELNKLPKKGIPALDSPDRKLLAMIRSKLEALDLSH